MKSNIIPKKSILLFCLSTLMFGPILVKAQDDKKKYAEGTALFNNGLYSQALNTFLSLDSIEPDNNNLNYKFGVCYYNAPVHQEKAIPYLVKACSDISAKYSPSNLKEKHAPADAYLYLAKAYHLNYQFDSAIASIHRFVALIDTTGDKQTEKDINSEIQQCLVGKQLVAHPVTMTVSDLGDSINSPFPDYSPVLSADESQIFFTSRRIGDKDPTSGQFYENIYIANYVNGNWQQARNIGEPINQKDKHDATVGLSPDGQTIFIYRDDGNGDGNIYTTHLNGTMWSTPQKLDENVDSKYWEPSASVSADGQVLYFSSNRPGGYGGLDIYMSRLLPNGQWGKAINLGPKINTSEDDDAPYIHPDGKTLYFSSKGHATMGGFDIFVSTLDSNNQWGTPTNIGYPVNTPGDDIFFFPTTDGKGAYYSSFKDSGLGEKDIYRIAFPEKKADAITVYRGLIISATDTVLPDNIEIIVTDNGTGEQVGVYRPNVSTGKYLIILPCGKNYNIAYNLNDTLFHKENLDVRDSTSYNVIDRAVDLKPLIIGQRIALKHPIKAPTGNAPVADDTKTELVKIYNLMQANKKLTLEVSGHSNGKGSEKENRAASQTSAEAMVKYLVGMGIDSTRLKAKGYGSEITSKNGQISKSEAGTNIDFKVLDNDTTGSSVPVNIKPYVAKAPVSRKPVASDNSKTEAGSSKLVTGNGTSTAIKNILVPVGQSDLSPEAKAELQKLHDFMVANKNVNVEISGYANGTGSESDNIAASRASAQTVINYLVSLGIDSTRLKAKGYGSSMASGKTKLTAEDGALIEYKILSTTPRNASAANNSANGNNTSEQLGSSKLVAANGKSTGIKNILVPADQSELSPEAKAELQKLHDFMVANKNVNVEISGYANGTGSESDNIAASRASAQAVINYLVSLGIDSNRLKAKGYGSSMASAKSKAKLTAGTGSLVEFKISNNNNASPAANAGTAKQGKNTVAANSANHISDKSEYDKTGVSSDDNVHFAIGKAEIVPKYYGLLQKLYDKMAQSKNITVEVMGHTDSLGGDYINTPLSFERAKAVVTYLVNKGIDKNRFTAKGFGANIPVERNKNSDGSWNWEGMRLNRRVEIKILNGGASGNEGTSNK